MRWLALAMLIALAVAQPSRAQAGAEARDATLRVVSSNIRFAGSDTGLLAWESRRDRLAALLASRRPALLGTQEGWRWQLSELAARLPDLTMIDRERVWEDGRMYPTLFYDRSRFELVESGDRWLSDTPEVPGSRLALSPYPRLVTWAVLRERASGVRLFVANTHLTHVLFWVRREQARILAEEILELNRARLPVILLGDFNERPTGGTRDLLDALLPEIRDPWGRGDQEGQATFNAFGGWLAGGRIDWILVDRDLPVVGEEILDARTGGDAEGPGGFASDHHPVAVTLRLRAEAPGA